MTTATATAQLLTRYDDKAGVIWFANRHQHPNPDVDSESGICGDVEIAVSQMNSPAQIIALIDHFRSKTWFTPEMLDSFWCSIMEALAGHGHNPHQLPDDITWRE
jgi:hypothetical protein